MVQIENSQIITIDNNNDLYNDIYNNLIIPNIPTCSSCGEECSMFSQICEICYRYYIGLITEIDSHNDQLNLVEEFPNEYEGVIYYRGIGSNTNLEYMSERLFRQTIFHNLNNFNEECPYNPRTCNLRELVEWVGAEMRSE
jgi:hypothetical protein